MNVMDLAIEAACEYVFDELARALGPTRIVSMVLANSMKVSKRLPMQKTRDRTTSIAVLHAVETLVDAHVQLLLA